MENWLLVIVLVMVGILILGISAGITGKAIDSGSSNSCYDSDGINANTPGVIKYKLWIFPSKVQMDTCAFDKKAVNERYCNGNIAGTKKISCQNGCISIQGYAFGKNVTSAICASSHN
jgi:hypothetical protein